MDAPLSPLVVFMSDLWAGSDGNWSTLSIQIGSPPQLFNFFPSTSAEYVAVPLSEGCGPEDPSNCGETRGVSQGNGFSSGFEWENSTSWIANGIYRLWAAKNLTSQNKALFGTDTISMQASAQSEAPKNIALQSSTVAGIATKDFPLGMFGLEASPTNFSFVSKSKISLISSLKKQQKIPSESYGYTAGASYRDIQPQAQLVLGGYDEARRSEMVLEVPIGVQEDTNSLVVGLQAILASDTLSGSVSMLQNSIYAVVDSTLPYIWLPRPACDLFENAFGLDFDPATELYLVNETVHPQLRKLNPTLTFRIGADLDGESINIELPYSAFDLSATWPLYNRSTMYFPIKRAVENQYTIGRTLLQEAYLVTDYERRVFELSQLKTNSPSAENIVTIHPPLVTPSEDLTGSNKDGTAALRIGLPVSIVVGSFLLGLTCISLYLRRKYLKRNTGKLHGDFTHEAGLTVEPRLMAPTTSELPGPCEPGELVGDAHRLGGELATQNIAQELGSPGVRVISGLHELSESVGAHTDGSRPSG